MPVFTRGSRKRKREQDIEARERRQARNVDEGQRAIKGQSSAQKRGWLAQRRYRAKEAEAETRQEAAKNRRAYRAGAPPTGEMGRATYPPSGAGYPTPEQPTREWVSEARFLKTYPRPAQNAASKLEGATQYYPWPSEARFAGMVGGYEPPPLTEEVTQPGAQPGAYYGGYGGGYGGYGGYGGGYGGGRSYGARQPVASGYPRRYTYLPEWLAKMAQWEI